MKTPKQTILTIFTVGMITSIGYAQEATEDVKSPEEYKNQFFMLPTSLADDIVQFGYERKIGKNSVTVQAGAYIKGQDALEDPTIGGAGIRLEANYNIIFNNMSSKKNTAVNFYLSPYVNYFNATYTIGKDYFNGKFASDLTDTTSLDPDKIVYPISEDGKAGFNHIGFGAIIGVRLTVAKRLVFDFYTGGGGQIADYVGENKDFRNPIGDTFIGNFTQTGVLGRGGIRVGILF